MAGKEFTTINYMQSLKQNVERKADQLNLEETGKSSSLKLEYACSRSLEISISSLIRHLVDHDKNPFWCTFLQDFEPDFEGDFNENCFLIIAIVEVLIKEIRVIGIESSAMRDIEKHFSEVKDIFEDDVFGKYKACLSSYEDVCRFSMLYWRSFNDFKKYNDKVVESEFRAIKKDVDDLEINLDAKKSDFDSKSSSIEKLLKEMEKRAGLLSLYAGFDKYGKVIKWKLRWLFLEKVVWVLGIGSAILFGLYLNLYENYDWTSLIPLAGIVLFFSTLLKVNLKKTDQYEQIMSKVEHKLAVSTFYQKELMKMEEGNDKQAVNEEYYKFLFSNIETTEWNTPDIASDIAKILKSYKK